MEKHPDLLHSRFLKKFLLESIKIILISNNCNFNHNFYGQIKGTAMGTIFGPMYAILTMGYFEFQFYNIC